MKYHHLTIYSDDTTETYHAITNILGVNPLKNEPNDYSASQYDVWTYSVESDETQAYFDFINVFLDLLEPNFDELEKLGIVREAIIIWLHYNYEHQCALGFSPQEMLRLGTSGITLNIDCWENKTQ